MENLSAKSHSLSPTIWIGKKGLDSTIIDEIKCQLKTRKMVKIKILKGALEHDIDRKKLPIEIAKQVKAEVVQKVGYVFTLYKN